MLHSIINHKAEVDIKEDTLTSSVIGLLQYLPSSIFWQLLYSSCHERNNLPVVSGEIEKIEFWTKWDSSNTDNTNFVEPDVFVRFESFDLIIEAKRYDGGGQYEGQWNKEIVSYYNQYLDDNKQLYFIALGGNVLLDNFNVQFEYPFLFKEEEKKGGEITKNIVVNKVNWSMLMSSVVQMQEELLSKKYLSSEDHRTQRLLNDVRQGFRFHGFYLINWFKNLRKYTISNKSEKLFHNINSLVK